MEFGLLGPVRAPPRPPACANALRASRTVLVFADGCQIADQRSLKGLVNLHRRAPLPLLDQRLQAMKSAICHISIEFIQPCVSAPPGPGLFMARAHLA